MLNRRQFLKVASILPSACVTAPATRANGTWVNDLHSQLNRTWVADLRRPASADELRQLIRSSSGPICTAGGRHAMGGQQFASNATLVDMSSMSRVRGVDEAAGVIDVEAGIQWPELIAALRDSRWGIRQKQTGADRLSIGGGLAANVHGRGLTMAPFVGDVESFTLVDARGDALECSRAENAEVFAHAIGGYGLFGIITSVRLRLSPKTKVERVVELQQIENVMSAFDERIANGFQYGDFQFSIDERSPDFLRKGVFSCYRPVSADTPVPPKQAELHPDDWLRLLYLAHADKAQAFERYAAYYLATSGQVYGSDEHQLSYYPDDYHRALDSQLKTARATEMITELYVPRPRLAELMHAAAEELRRRRANVVYGTVRLIERDTETVLAWAKQPYACVIFNLHVEHGAEGEARAADTFRALIDLALEREGNYFLTYHRWARRDQVERGYPRFAEFLRAKRHFDPGRRFTSEWHRHYERMFA